MCIYSTENGKFTDMTNGQGQALEAEMRSHANYEHFTKEGNWKIQIREIISEEEFIATGRRPLNFYVNFFG